MRALAQSWLCFFFLVAVALFLYSFPTRRSSDLRSSAFSIQRFREGMPLPPLTQWFLALSFPQSNPFFTASFYPTLCASAYFWHLLRRTSDATERNTRFALAAIAAFLFLASILLLGAV